MNEKLNVKTGGMGTGCNCQCPPSLLHDHFYQKYFAWQDKYHHIFVDDDFTVIWAWHLSYNREEIKMKYHHKTVFYDALEAQSRSETL